MTDHLLDEPPIIVYPSLAAKIGINAAVIFQQLHFLIQSVQRNETEENFRDGKWWIYNTYEDWQRKYFIWLSTSTLKGVFNELEKQGLIQSRQGVKHKSDREKWYTIDYEAWNNYSQTIGQKMSDGHETKNVRSKRQKMSDDSYKTKEKETKNIKESAVATLGDTSDNSPENNSIKEDKKARKERLDQLFEIIALGSFGKPYAALNGQRGRAGEIRKLLLEEKPDITPEYLKAGYARYFEANPTIKHDPSKRMKKASVIIDWCEQAADCIAPVSLKPKGDPNCPKCRGEGEWLDKITDPYNHKFVECECVKVLT